MEGHATAKVCILCGSTAPLDAPNWREVPAIWLGGAWIYEAESPAKIMVCPDCRVAGEPKKE